jgi:hypothetical protein
VGQILDATGPGLAAVGPLVQPLQELAEPVATRIGATGLPQGDVSALPTQAIPMVQSTTDGGTSALQDATAATGSVVEGATGSVGATTDAVAPSGLRAADLPTMRLPVVGEARTPLVADDSPTTPLRIVPPADEPGPSVDSPTLPLRIVQPARPDTDGAQDDVRSDGAQERTEVQDSGRDSSRSNESDGSEPSGTSGSGGGGLSNAGSSVTGLLNH